MVKESKVSLWLTSWGSGKLGVHTLQPTSPKTSIVFCTRKVNHGNVSLLLANYIFNFFIFALLHFWCLHFLTVEAFLFPEDLVGVEDWSSDSSPPVAMLFRLKIQRWLCSGSLKLGTAACAAAQAMPRVHRRGIHKMCIHPNQERAFRALCNSQRGLDFGKAALDSWLLG